MDARVKLGRPNYLHDIASQATLDGMTCSLARELGPDGITVNAILPGATFTEIERKTVTPDCRHAVQWPARKSRRTWSGRRCSWPRMPRLS